MQDGDKNEETNPAFLHNIWKGFADVQAEAKGDLPAYKPQGNNDDG